MRILLILLLICMYGISDLIGQSNIFELRSQDISAKIRAYNMVPEVYRVVNQNISYSVKDSKKKRTKAYTTLLDSLRTLEKTLIVSEKVAIKEEYNSIPRIITSIEKYNGSKLHFDLKKKYLVDAQKLLERSGRSEIVYADNKLNSANLPTFLALKQNPMDLKIHLKRVIWDLDKSRPIMISDDTMVSNNDLLKNQTSTLSKIAALKKKLAKTTQFEITQSASTKLSRKILQLHEQIDEPANMSGTYEISVQPYYVMGYDFQEVKRGELLLQQEVDKMQLNLKQMEFENARFLIKNQRTGQQFLVTQNFWEKFQFKYNNQSVVNTTRGEVDKQSVLHRNQNSQKVQKTTNTNYRVVSSKVRSANGNRVASNTKPHNSEARGVERYHQTRKIVQDPSHTPTSSLLDTYREILTESKGITEILKSHHRASQEGKMTPERTKKWKEDIRTAERIRGQILTIVGTKPKAIEQINEKVEENYVLTYRDFATILDTSLQLSGF